MGRNAIRIGLTLLVALGAIGLARPGAAAEPASTAADTLAEPAALPLASWREAARLLPRISAMPHADASVPFGPVLFARGSSPAALVVTLDDLPLADAYSGQTTFELPLEALAAIRTNADGSLSLLTRETPRSGFGVRARAGSEALVPAGDGLQVAGRERYDLVGLAGARGAAGSLAFVGAAQRRWFADRDPRFVDSPIPRAEAAPLGAAGFADGRQPANALGGGSGYGRLAWRPPSGAWELSAAAAASHDDWREFRQAYLFDIAHAPRAISDFAVGGVSFARAGAVRVNLHATLADSRFRHGDGVWLDDLQGLGLATSAGNPGFDFAAPYFFSPGHVYPTFDRWRSTRDALSGTLAWSPARSHSVRLAADWARSAVRRYSVYFADLVRDTSGAVIGANADRFGYDALGRESSSGVRRPTTTALDASDTFAPWPGGGVETGLRFDRIDGWQRATVPLDSLGQPAGAPGRLEARTFVSPRVALRARLGEGLRVRMSLRRTVSAPAPAAMALGAGGWPEVSTDAEVGCTRALGTATGLDVAAWQREFSQYTTAAGELSDDASARGVDLMLTHRAGRRTTFVLGTTFARTRVRLLLRNQRNIAWTGVASPSMVVPTDEDRMVRAFTSVTARMDDGPGTPAWRRAWRLDLLARAESGVPYTPTLPYDEVTLAAVAPYPTGPINSARQPWAVTADFGLARPLRTGGLEMTFTLQVLNVFDRHNARSVYTGTGSADETTWLSTPDGQSYASYAGEQGTRLFELAQHQPGNWDRPRTVTLALAVTY